MVYTYPGCKNLKVEGAKDYIDRISPMLDAINSVDVGKTLFKFIEKTGKKTLTIFSDGKKDWNTIGAREILRADLDAMLAKASKLLATKRNPTQRDVDAAWDKVEKEFESKVRVDNFAKGQPVTAASGHLPPVFVRLDMLTIYQKLDIPFSWQYNTSTVGSGKGRDAEIQFDPEGLKPLIKSVGGAPLGFDPPEVLFHEMVHAYRQMAGAELGENVPEHWQMDSNEEFFAILAANMLRSSRGLTGLRYDHHTADPLDETKGFTSLPADLTDPKAFYQKFKPQIVKWFNNQPDFCAALARSSASFNPMAIAARDLRP